MRLVRLGVCTIRAKSRGPTSDEGRQKIRFNALRHGLRAATFDLEAIRALPEDPDGVQDCIAAWEADLGPVGPLEHFYVGRAAVLSIRLGDCQASEQDLRDDAMRKAADLFLDRAQASARHRGARLERDPAGTTEVLRQSTFGCDWILRKLVKLEEMVAGGDFWNEAERRLALNLMGFDPYQCSADDEPFVRQVITLALAIDPNPDRAWVDWALEDGLQERDRAARRAEARAGLGPEAEARRALLELIREELEALRSLRDGLWREVDGPTLRAAQYRARSEASRSAEGEQLQRYELRHAMDLNRTLNAYYKARAQRRAEEESAPNEPGKPAGPGAGSPSGEGICAENRPSDSGAPTGVGAASGGVGGASERTGGAGGTRGIGGAGALRPSAEAGSDPGHTARPAAAPAPNEPEKSAGPEAESPFRKRGCGENPPSGSGAPAGVVAASAGRRVAVAEPAPTPVGDRLAPGAAPAAAGSDPGHPAPAQAPNEPEKAASSEAETTCSEMACAEKHAASPVAPVGAGAAPEGRRVAGVEPAEPVKPPVGDGPSFAPGAPPAVAGSDPGHAGTCFGARVRRPADGPAPAPNEPETVAPRPIEPHAKLRVYGESAASVAGAPNGAGSASSRRPAPGLRVAIESPRLALDPSVSKELPVVKGTRFTTAEVAERQASPYGWSEERIAEHFGIETDDVLACTEYEVQVILLDAFNGLGDLGNGRKI